MRTTAIPRVSRLSSRWIVPSTFIAQEYEVDIDAMTSTNKESKKARALHRMQLRILGVNDMLEAGSTAPFSALINNGWTMHWQVEDFCGWKNVTEASNQTLLNASTAPNALEDAFISLHDILRGSHPDNVERPLRLVALTEWYNS